MHSNLQFYIYASRCCTWNSEQGGFRWRLGRRARYYICAVSLRSPLGQAPCAARCKPAHCRAACRRRAKGPGAIRGAWCAAHMLRWTRTRVHFAFAAFACVRSFVPNGGCPEFPLRDLHVAPLRDVHMARAEAVRRWDHCGWVSLPHNCGATGRRHPTAMLRGRPSHG